MGQKGDLSGMSQVLQGRDDCECPKNNTPMKRCGMTPQRQPDVPLNLKEGGECD